MWPMQLHGTRSDRPDLAANLSTSSSRFFINIGIQDPGSEELLLSRRTPATNLTIGEAKFWVSGDRLSQETNQSRTTDN
jgi:hypothetical protein